MEKIQRWFENGSSIFTFYNGNLESLIWEDIVVFLTSKKFISEIFSLASCMQEIVPFADKPQMKINSLKKLKHGDLIHTWSDKAFKGTVVNRALTSLHGESLEITFTVLLRKIKLTQCHLPLHVALCLNPGFQKQK